MRSKGKLAGLRRKYSLFVVRKDCMFEQTGLGLFIFDENKLIAVHDYERKFSSSSGHLQV